jgi:hypothetical protein
MAALPVQNGKFRVDTSRPRSRSKMRAKFRHVMGVAAGMFPLMAAFVFVMSLFQIAEQRKSLHQLAAVFLGCGMASLLFYAWARSEKLRRHEISRLNREQRQRRQAEALRREREKGPADAAGTSVPSVAMAKEG